MLCLELGGGMRGDQEGLYGIGQFIEIGHPFLVKSDDRRQFEISRRRLGMDAACRQTAPSTWPGSQAAIDAGWLRWQETQR